MCFLLVEEPGDFVLRVVVFKVVREQVRVKRRDVLAQLFEAWELNVVQRWETRNSEARTERPTVTAPHSAEVAGRLAARHVGADVLAREAVERQAVTGFKMVNGRNNVPAAHRVRHTRDTDKARALVGRKFRPAERTGERGVAELLDSSREPHRREEVPEVFAVTLRQGVADGTDSAEDLRNFDPRLVLQELSDRHVVGSRVIFDEAEDNARDVEREDSKKGGELSDAEILAGLHVFTEQRRPEKENPKTRTAASREKKTFPGGFCVFNDTRRGNP